MTTWEYHEGGHKLEMVFDYKDGRKVVINFYNDWTDLLETATIETSELDIDHLLNYFKECYVYS